VSFPSASFVFLLALPVSLTAQAQNPPSASQQILPAVPPALDPGFWGQPNHPYVLKMLVTKTSVDGTTPPQAHSSGENVYRDSTGRVRTETFYDNGRPMGVALQDPHKNTFTFMHLVEKSAIVMPVSPPPIPPPGRGWSEERLPPRVIAGFPAEGLRFTRTIPSAATGTGAPVTVVEDDWISTQLGVLLEQTLRDPRQGTTTKIVTRFEQTEPEPTLFTVPSDYSVQQANTAAP
jgi:hypothetical protein